MACPSRTSSSRRSRAARASTATRCARSSNRSRCPTTRGARCSSSRRQRTRGSRRVSRAMSEFLPRDFLRRYWQREPLLIRQAFPGFASPLAPDDLAGFACEPLANSRLVVHDAKRDRWTVKHGPLAEADFAKLPKKDWTLLVQDVDKLVDEVAALRDAFRFVPQ